MDEPKDTIPQPRPDEPAKQPASGPKIASLTKLKKKAAGDRKVPERTAAMEKELLERIGFLRQSCRETGRAYVANLEHDLAEIGDQAKELVRGPGGRSKKAGAVLETLVEIAEAIRLKPAKGRRKDLKRVELAVAAMSRALAKKKSDR